MIVFGGEDEHANLLNDMYVLNFIPAGPSVVEAVAMLGVEMEVKAMTGVGAASEVEAEAEMEAEAVGGGGGGGGGALAEM